MEYLAIFILFILFGLIVYFINERSLKTPPQTRFPIYRYTAKKHVMTKSEEQFFNTLVSITQDRYYIFPQVHLSSLLDHRVNGQKWLYAFRHINGKSVDFVICNKQLEFVVAIELDDWSHDNEDRKIRDLEVERIFKESSLPLIRFRDNVSRNDIRLALLNIGLAEYAN